MGFALGITPNTSRATSASEIGAHRAMRSWQRGVVTFTSRGDDVAAGTTSSLTTWRLR